MKRIFVLACGPRSGSTFLQRLLTSTGDVLIWGETAAFGSTANLYDRLARAPGWDKAPWFYREWKHITPSINNNWTNDADQGLNWNLHEFHRSGPNMWMALMQPLRSDALPAVRRFLDDLYGSAARKEGFDGWGTKEVYWTRHTVEFLLGWQDAHIVFIHRDLSAILTSRFAGTVPYYGRQNDELLLRRLHDDTTRIAAEFANHDRCLTLDYEQLGFETILATCQQLSLSEPSREVFDTRIG